MDIYHRLNVFFGSFPALPDERVVELLGGRVFPLRRVPGAGNGRHFTIQWELHLLAGRAFLSEGGHLIEGVKGFALSMVDGTLRDTRRMR